MQQPEDELLLEGAGRHLRHPQKSVDALRKALSLFLLISNQKIIQAIRLAGNDLETSEVLYLSYFALALSQKNAFHFAKVRLLSHKVKNYL